MGRTDQFAPVVVMAYAVTAQLSLILLTEMLGLQAQATLIWLLQTKALIMTVFANLLLDKPVLTRETFLALLLVAVVSTMLSILMVRSILRRRAPSRSAAKHGTLPARQACA